MTCKIGWWYECHWFPADVGRPFKMQSEHAAVPPVIIHLFSGAAQKQFEQRLRLIVQPRDRENERRIASCRQTDAHSHNLRVGRYHCSLTHWHTHTLTPLYPLVHLSALMSAFAAAVQVRGEVWDRQCANDYARTEKKKACLILVIHVWWCWLHIDYIQSVIVRKCLSYDVWFWVLVLHLPSCQQARSSRLVCQLAWWWNCCIQNTHLTRASSKQRHRVQL